jgi:hypothetical protein
MKLISKEEMPEVLPVRRKRNTLLRTMLLQLEVGAGLFMPRTEWKAKNPPAYVVAGIRKSHGYRYDYGLQADGSGWLFRRVA